MRIFLSPQVGLEFHKIDYSFEGESITATLELPDETLVSDVFDFSGFTDDGEVEGNEIETSLPFSPVSFARREGGILSVQLVNLITEDSTEAEKFPEWIEV